jgi:transketolase
MVLRPADGNETSGAYKVAIQHRTRPSLLALSRQAVPNLAGTSLEGVAKGGYVISDSEGTPDLILLGTGSELQLCVRAAEQLRLEGHKVRVVSMVCWELFAGQAAAYRASVLPKAVRKRLAVEAAVSFGWCRYLGDEGVMISVETFGSSAPGNVCLERFGFTVDNVLSKARELLG